MEQVEQLEPMESSPIQQFYQDKCILITGGTGFMGKVLTEKLLRTCPGVSQIFLIVRPKKDKSVLKRVEEIFADPVSDEMKRYWIDQ